MPTPKIKFRLDKGAIAPTKAYPGDAGYDLYTLTEYAIMPGDFVDVRTGLYIEAPKGYYTRITSRSSTFRAYRLTVIEGIIDNGYRGELCVSVYNPSRTKYSRIAAGARIAQLMIHKIHNVDWQEVEKLSDSPRNSKGYGSSGT